MLLKVSRSHLKQLVIDSDSLHFLVHIANSVLLSYHHCASLQVNLEGVYQKRYLNSLESLSFLNLGLLSALAAVYQNDSNSEQIVTIISVSVVLVTLFYCSYNLTHNSSFSSQLQVLRAECS